MVFRVFRCQQKVVRFLILTGLFSVLFYSCGDLPKENTDIWVKLQLELHSNFPSRMLRSGTGTRGSELAIVVRPSTKFSEEGPQPNQAIDWKKVNTVDNTISLLLPTREPFQLFVYRYRENYSLFELEQKFYSRSLHQNVIDFGKSEVFSIDSSGRSISVNGRTSSILTIQLARQISGKLSQGYVRGARVWADRLDSQGKANQKLDDDENFTNSGTDGDYYLAPDYLDYILTSEGGFRIGASGEYIPAAPMLATLPEDGQTEVNITPLTTLVAVAPDLEPIFLQSGDWRADIASPDGIPGNLLRIAKVTEAFWTLMSGGSNPIMQNTQQQLSGLSILAQKFAEGGRTALLEELPLLVGQAVDESLSDPEISRPLSNDSQLIFNKQLTDLTVSLSKLLPNNDQVIEKDLLSEFDHLNELAFTSVETVVCAFPGEVTVQFDPVILSISLVPTSETTISLRGVVSDDDFDALSTYWAINPPDELRDVIDPLLINATVNQYGYVETVLTIENWDQFGSVSLQLTECSPVNVISESCNWVPNTSQINCNFME